MATTTDILGEVPFFALLDAAMDLLSATGRRLRETNRLLRMAATKDINGETDDRHVAKGTP